MSGASPRRSGWLRSSTSSRQSFNTGNNIVRVRSAHGFGRSCRGYYQYHAVPGNTGQLRIFRRRICRLWRSVLVRRSQRAKLAWHRLNPLLNRWIPHPRVLHPILTSASTPFIVGKSRMRKRTPTDLCGGRSAMVVPTATTGNASDDLCADRRGSGASVLLVSRAEHGLETPGDSLYPCGKNGRPEWTRTIDLFRVKVQRS